MSDPSITDALTYGGSLLAGGGISSIVVRFLFADVAKRLDRIEKTLEDAGKQQDARHESMVERMVRVETKADAAHRRLDELGQRRRK